MTMMIAFFIAGMYLVRARVRVRVRVWVRVRVRFGVSVRVRVRVRVGFRLGLHRGDVPDRRAVAVLDGRLLEGPSGAHRP